MERAEQRAPHDSKQRAINCVRTSRLFPDILDIAAQGTKHLLVRVESLPWPRDQYRPGICPMKSGVAMIAPSR